MMDLTLTHLNAILGLSLFAFSIIGIALLILRRVIFTAKIACWIVFLVADWGTIFTEICVKAGIDLYQEAQNNIPKPFTLSLPTPMLSTFTSPRGYQTRAQAGFTNNYGDGGGDDEGDKNKKKILEELYEKFLILKKDFDELRGASS